MGEDCRTMTAEALRGRTESGAGIAEKSLGGGVA